MKRHTTRPLPPYRHRPGQTPHPVLDKEGHLHGQEEPDRPPFDTGRWMESEAYLWGVDLFNQGYFWEAHEAWEGLWRSSRGTAEGEFLRGLIQVAAAFLKYLEGRATGLRNLRSKAYVKLRALAQSGPACCGIRLEEWMAGVDSALLQAGTESSSAAPTLEEDLLSESNWRICLVFPTQ